MGFYLITGGAGFIGSNICEKLIQRSHKVRIIDNFSTGKEENIRDFRNDIEVINGDIRDISLVRNAVKGVDYVLHQAALSSVPRSIEDPISSNDNNINGTLNVLVAARDEGVKRVVYAASSSSYGDTVILPKIEEMSGNPLSPYAITKYTGELYAKVFNKIYGLQTVGLRYFNIFGPKQDPDSQYSAVIPKFVKSLLRGEAPIIFGDGDQSRDFTYIDNAVEANILASNSKNVGNGEVINIACGERINLNELVNIINSCLGTNINATYTKERKGDVKHSLASIKMAEELLGYKVEVDPLEGIKRYIEFVKKMDNCG